MPIKNSQKMMACPHCDLVMRHRHEHLTVKLTCPRCHSTLKQGWYLRDSGLAVLLLTAILMYIPANFYPLVGLERLGEVQYVSVFNGIQHMFFHGQWFTAMVVWFCSMCIPAVIIAVLVYVLVNLKLNRRGRHLQELFRLYCHMGEWSMLDIYLLSFCVTFYKIYDMGEVKFGWGLIAFVALALVIVDILVQTNKPGIWRRLAKCGSSPDADCSEVAGNGESHG